MINIKNRKVKFRDMSKAFFIHVFILMFITFGLAEACYLIIMNMEIEKEKKELYDMTHQYAQKIQASISAKIHIVDTVEAMIKLADFDTSTFDDWAPTVYRMTDGLEAVQLAPSGVVEHTHPLAGNEKVIGHDLLHDSRRSNGARKAIEDRRLTFVGPITLMQNGKSALIGRKPIFVTDQGQSEFWGFAIVVIGINDLFDNTVGEIMEKGYEYRIIGDNPDDKVNKIIYMTDETVKRWDTSFPFIVPNGTWSIQVAKLDNVTTKSIWIHRSLQLAGILLGFLLSYQHYRKVKQAIEIEQLNLELETLSYTDELTGLRNRRGCVEALKQAMERAKEKNHPLSVAIMDIDKFKSINDTYGHDAGDEVIKEIGRLYNYYGAHHTWTLGRWGGDEFIAIFEEIDAERAYALLDGFTKNLNSNKRKSNYKYIKLTMSIGIAQYEKGSMDHLLVRADKGLYKAKMAGRDRIEVN